MQIDNPLHDSWKYSNVFKKQLDLCKQELSSSAPPIHWAEFSSILKLLKPRSLLDVGCGCGVFYLLSKHTIPDLKYLGIDYAEKAISTAKSAWKYAGFVQKDLFEINQHDVKDFDLIYLGAVFDVLPNGDKALEHILSLSAGFLAIGRIRFTENPSYFQVYKAYNEIETCRYFHNSTNFKNLCQQYRYSIKNIGTTLLLTKFQ
jgi:trans-aconitate methyltransferase